MLTFFLIISVLVAVLVLIRVLHTTQVGESRRFAEQSSPLPPLEAPDAEQHNAVSISADVAVGEYQALPWQDEVRALRDAGRFQEALSLCRRQYPRMLAFRQTLITLRAKMRQDNDPSDELLNSLYLTAMLGDLCRDRKPGEQDFEAIRRRLEQRDEPKHYWQQIGYRHLQMLSKTDKRVLVERWGEPGNHGDISELVQ